MVYRFTLLFITLILSQVSLSYGQNCIVDTIPSNALSDNTSAIVSDGDYLWVGSSNYNILKLSKTDGTIVKQLTVDIARPYGMELIDGSLWVMEGSHFSANDSIHKIDTITGATLKKIPAKSMSGDEAGLAWDGEYLWHCERNSSQLYKIDTLNGDTSSLQVLDLNLPTAMSFDGEFLWISDNQTHKIYQYDTLNRIFKDTIDVISTFPNGISVENDFLWAAYNGTDSIYKIDLPCETYCQVFASQSITACDSSEVHSNWYFASQTIIDTLISTEGCDSIITTSLTINESTSSTEVITSCDSYTWSVNGMTYTISGNYTSTIANSVGCDSVLTLDLTINESTSSTEIVTACDSYTWSVNGMTYTMSGDYTATIANSVGCDSVLTLDLTINESTSSTEIITACDSYTWSVNGMTYTMSGNYTATIANSVGCDSVLTLDLTINESTSSTEIITACDSYTWSVNGMTYTMSGDYTATIPNSAGCDSVLTLDLTINNLNTTVNQTSNILTVTMNNATYQWLDCDNGYVPLENATSQQYEATQNGNYAVAVMANGCIDTSDCVQVLSIGIRENIPHFDAQISPNPTEGRLSIALDERLDNVIISVYDILGKLQMQEKYSSIQSADIFIEGEKGIYLIEIKTKDGRVVHRIMKE